ASRAGRAPRECRLPTDRRRGGPSARDAPSRGSWRECAPPRAKASRARGGPGKPAYLCFTSGLCGERVSRLSPRGTDPLAGKRLQRLVDGLFDGSKLGHRDRDPHGRLEARDEEGVLIAAILAKADRESALARELDDARARVLAACPLRREIPDARD